MRSSQIPATNKFISIASVWEIAIKVNTGKLNLKMPFAGLRQQLNINAFETLSINFEHTHVLCSLELHHRDPFDRMIIAQSIAENLILISKDKHFASYQNLKLLW